MERKSILWNVVSSCGFCYLHLSQELILPHCKIDTGIGMDEVLMQDKLSFTLQPSSKEILVPIFGKTAKRIVNLDEGTVEEVEDCLSARLNINSVKESDYLMVEFDALSLKEESKEFLNAKSTIPPFKNLLPTSELEGKVWQIVKNPSTHLFINEKERLILEKFTNQIPSKIIESVFGVCGTRKIFKHLATGKRFGLPREIFNNNFPIFWLESLQGEDKSALSLIEKCCEGDGDFCLRYFWYLNAELDEEIESERTRFLQSLLDNFIGRMRGTQSYADFCQQLKFTQTLSKSILQLKTLKTPRKEMVRELQRMFKRKLFPMSHPLFPQWKVDGISLSSINVFKSSQMPVKFEFLPKECAKPVIFKCGDDLRQDALAIELIRFIDHLWKEKGLDLQILTYSVLPTGKHQGYIEFVSNSSPLSEIVDLERFLSDSLEKRSNFVKSCAGYSVITHVLGIGDRHLDNLMIHESGRLFHIDFAFMFGRDPKPFAPPIKLTTEMLEILQKNTLSQFIWYFYLGFCALQKKFELLLWCMEQLTRCSASDFPANFEDLFVYVRTISHLFLTPLSCKID